MNDNQQPKMMATAGVAAPGLLTQVGMAGSAAVMTVSFIHPIDVVKVSDLRSARRLEVADEAVGPDVVLQ